MAQATDILDIDEAKLWVTLSASRAGQEDRLEQWVSGVSQALDEYAGPVVKRTITNEEHNAYGCGSIIVKEPPVYSVTSVSEYVSGAQTVLTAEDFDTSGTYRVDGDVIYRRDSWADTTFTGIVVVTYEAGLYANTAAVSEQYKTACGMALQRLWVQYAPASARRGDPDVVPDTGFYFRAITPAAQEMGIRRRPKVLVA